MFWLVGVFWVFFGGFSFFLGGGGVLFCFWDFVSLFVLLFTFLFGLVCFVYLIGWLIVLGIFCC